MKRILSSLLAICLVLPLSAAAPKYVFYFIGDGMGVNVVQLTEMYLASLKGEIGVEPLVFSQFPVVTFGTTYSADSDVTDSSASGTALATGVKTVNNHLGLDKDDNYLTSIAVKAKNCGKKVGIATSVAINHATPASFYAHQQDRGWYYKIAMDMISADFDFYAGSHLEQKNRLEDGTRVRNAFEVMEEAGYTHITGVDDFNARCGIAKKIIMTPQKGKGMMFGIDRIGMQRDSSLTLRQVTESAVRFLDNRKGFFLMVEGGNIDGAEHGHDAATAIHEVLDFNDAIQVAMDFYKKHPNETLIVVTADHETGGLSLNPKTPADLSLLQYQILSQERTSGIFGKLVKKMEPEILSWEETKDFLKEYFGLWGAVPVSWEQEKYLHDTYELTVARSELGHQIDLYADNALLIARAVQVLNTNSSVHWTTSHSAGMVPTYAIGVGQEKFSRKMDNTLIPQIIAETAGY